MFLLSLNAASYLLSFFIPCALYLLSTPVPSGFFLGSSQRPGWAFSKITGCQLFTHISLRSARHGEGCVGGQLSSGSPASWGSHSSPVSLECPPCAVGQLYFGARWLLPGRQCPWPTCRCLAVGAPSPSHLPRALCPFPRPLLQGPWCTSPLT